MRDLVRLEISKHFFSKNKVIDYAYDALFTYLLKKQILNKTLKEKDNNPNELGNIFKTMLII